MSATLRDRYRRAYYTSEAAYQNLYDSCGCIRDGGNGDLRPGLMEAVLIRAGAVVWRLHTSCRKGGWLAPDARPPRAAVLERERVAVEAWNVWLFVDAYLNLICNFTPDGATDRDGPPLSLADAAVEAWKVVV